MSSSVDEEVIRLKLDNSSFASSVTTALNLFDRLRQSMNFSNAGKSIDEVGAKAGRFNLGGMLNSVDGVSKSFLALSAVGITALTNITNKAVDSALQIGKSFTFGPVAQGFQDYETQIGAIQTVLANTGLKGDAGIGVVNAALDQLNHYADKTIYSFPEMAKNVGTFTAAGVGLDQSVNAIKGVANLAALSGSNSEQASTAMYQLSQAIAANKVGLQDWNSVVNAGMGGQIFKEALFNTGKLKGTLQGVDANTTFDEWTASGNSFRDSLQDGWITGEVLTDTLSQFTGDLTDAQLASMGYNADQIAQIQEMAKTANNAATQIKTYSQLKDTLRESVGSAYAGIFRSLFGDIGAATTLFTSLNVVLSKIFVDPVNNLATLVQGFVDLGGRTALINGIGNAFRFLQAVIKPIKEAFREIFPAQTAEGLYRLVSAFAAFSTKLTVSGETADKLKRTFAGVFAIFGILKTVVMDAGQALFQAFAKMGKGSGSILDLSAKMGDLSVAFYNAVKNSGIVFAAFSVIGEAINFVVSAIKIAIGFIGKLFDGFKVDTAHETAGSLDKVSDSLFKVSDFISNFGDKMTGVSQKIGPIGDKISAVFTKIGDKIASVFGTTTFSNLLSGLNAGLLAGVAVLLKKFLSNGLSVDIGGGFLGKLGETLEGVTGQLSAMQTELKARALMEIAIAIALLAASIAVLSFIDPDKLGNALGALGLGFAVVMKSVSILNAMLSGPGAVKIIFAAVAIGLLSASMLILAGAMLIFAHMSWEEIGRGLAAVTGLMIGLSVAIRPLSAGGPGTIFAAGAILILSVALNILAGAVKLFSTMSWSEMLQGLAGIGIALVGIAGAMYLFPPGMVFIAAGLLILSIALIGIYEAVKNFSSLSWTEMGKGLAGISGALLGIGLAVMLMPPTLPLIALGLIGVSLALGKIQEAVGAFGGMSWIEIARGLVALGGSMLVLAIGLSLMTGTLAGAAALVVVAFGLALFVPILKQLGQMSWGVIGKGILILAIALGALALISSVLSAFVPAILGLGAALIVVGAGVLLFGAGIALLGVGLGFVAASGGAAIGILIGALSKLGDILPTVAIALAKGLVTFLNTILQAAPQIVTAIVGLLNQLLTAIPGILPQLATAATALITTLLQILLDNVPNIVQTGLTLLIALLDGIQQNLGNVVDSVTNIITTFLNSLAEDLPKIVEAGVNLLFKFLEGVAYQAGQIPAEAVKIIKIFITSLVESFPGVTSTGKDIINKLIEGIANVASSIYNTAKNLGISIVTKIAEGLGNLLDFGKSIITKITGAFSDLKDVGAKALSIGSSIVSGIISGIGDIGSAIWNKVKAGLNSAIESAKKFLGIGGPAKMIAKELGEPIPWGMAKGIDDGSHRVDTSINNLNKSATSKMQEAMSNVADTIQNGSDFKPVITPVLDLTQMQKDASKIPNYIKVWPVKADLSTTSAGTVNGTDYELRNAPSGEDTKAGTGGDVIFNQHNTSPEPLSPITVYRMTNNALAAVKDAIGLPKP